MTQEPGAPQAGSPAPIQPSIEVPPTGSVAEWPTPRPSTTALPRRSRSRWLDIALGVAAVVAVAGLAFAAGRLTAPARAFGGFAGGNFPGGNLAPGETPGPGLRGRFDGGNFALTGSIVSVTSDQLTIKLASGQTVTIPLASSTTYHQQAPAGAGDLASGSNVLVRLQPSATNGGIRIGPLPPASDVTLLSP